MANSAKYHDYTLITGGSQGIGAAMAREFARLGRPVLLVALPGPELAETALSLQRDFGVPVQYFAVDLTLEGAAQAVFDWVRELDVSVDILVNNAGIGGKGMFHLSDPDRNAYMIKLNVLAVLELTRVFLPDMLHKDRAWLLFTSSLAGLLPLPYKTVYTGTKSFLYAYALALGAELKGSSVHVSVFCPGPVVTSQDVAARLESHGSRSGILIKQVDFVARAAVRGLLRRKRVISPGLIIWTVGKTARILPTGLKMWLLERIFRVHRDLEEETTEKNSGMHG